MIQYAVYTETGFAARGVNHMTGKRDLDLKLPELWRDKPRAEELAKKYSGEVIAYDCTQVDDSYADSVLSATCV